MVTTVAPTMPVEAASSAPTSDTETAKPPRTLPNRRPIASSSSGAMRDFSSIMPMKTKRGMAISTSLVMVPNTRWASAPNRKGSKVPARTPSAPKRMEQPVSTNTTGRPVMMRAQSATIMMRSSEDAMPLTPR